MAVAGSPFHVMTKPIGPICNLGCEYCFYLSKELLYPQGEPFRMSDELLERYVRQYIEAQPGQVISFAWQGGEPTLMGLEFFRRAVALQRQYTPPGKTVENAIQTNGVLLDDEWGRFLKENNFLVGISLDGPAELHDRYRVDKGGQPTFDRVMRGLSVLRRHGVDFNILCVVNRLNAGQPLAVYRFFKEIGATYIQFIPLVEPVGGEAVVSPRSVVAADYGEFLVAIFEEWVRGDIGKVFVQSFEEAARAWLGVGPSLCIFQEQCGRALVVEHDGGVFACDHYVDPQHKLGSLTADHLADLVDSEQQQAFGRAKQETLPKCCRECPVRFACNGECPKNRIILSPDGEPGLNYLCAGYKRFFTHIDPYMRRLAGLLRAGRSAQVLMQELQAERRLQFQSAGRNDPCPCGSGRKYKQCCLGRRPA